MIKVTNNSARLHTNVGGHSVIPGQSVVIDDCFLPDVKNSKELATEENYEGEETAEVAEAASKKTESKADEKARKKAEVEAAKAGWGKTDPAAE